MTDYTQLIADLRTHAFDDCDGRDVATHIANIAADTIAGLVKAHDARVTELINYNSDQVIQRRVAMAKLNIAEEALENIETQLGDWLTDNTENVFEEQPEIDGARGLVDDARQAIRAVDPADYGPTIKVDLLLWPMDANHRFGDLVQKKGRTQWRGRVVGWYRTELTKLGFAVESAFEKGSVQIYPQDVLVGWPMPLDG